MERENALAEMIGKWVAYATKPFEAVVELGVEHAEDPDAVEGVWDLTDRLFAEHLAAQRNWPELTDSDRLTRAFRDLDQADIVAREVFTCCQTCGHAEIIDEYSPGLWPRGYVFYHEQDADAAITGNGIYLAYDGDNQKAVGREVVTALRTRGLRPQWNGSPSTRIMLPLTWQRRRLGRLAAHPGTIGGEDFTVTAEPLDGWEPLPPSAGATSAKAWAALRLPWLPTGRRLALHTEDGTSLMLQRDWDRLHATLPSGERAEAYRTDAWALVSLLTAAAHQPQATVTPEPMLEVSYHHQNEASDGLIPMTVAECVNVLHDIPVRTGNWATYTSRSGIVLQHKWEDGPRLWLEFVDASSRSAHGRHVSIEQAQKVIRILAEEDRIVMAPLGRLETRYW